MIKDFLIQPVPVEICKSARVAFLSLEKHIDLLNLEGKGDMKCNKNLTPSLLLDHV